MKKNIKSLIIEITEKELRILPLNSKSKIVDFAVLEFRKGFWDDESLLNAEELTVLLRQYKEQFLRQENVAVDLLIPLEHGLIKEFEIPWVKTSYRNQALLYLIEDEIPIPLSELYFDYVIWEDKKTNRIHCYFSAVRKEILTQYRKCLHKAGYRAEGVEFSITAFSGILSKNNVSRAIYLSSQTLLQIIIYENSQPVAVRHIEKEQHDLRKYLLYLGLRELYLPVDYIINDDSSQDVLVESLNEGIAKEQLFVEKLDYFDESSHLLLAEYGSKVYGVLGAQQKYEARKIKRINLNNEYIKQRRNNWLLAIITAFMLSTGVFIKFCWMPLYLETQNIQGNYEAVEQKLEEFKAAEQIAFLTEWKTAFERAGKNVEKLKKIADYQTDNLQVQRLNYKSGQIYIWLKGKDNADISKFTDHLIVNGYQVPSITNYHYDSQQGITCRITVGIK